MDKSYLRNISTDKNNIILDTFMLLLILLLAFLVCLTSPVNIWQNNGLTATDSSVFKTVALYMERGLMPYKDIFDHKGPLLYFYNWWGLQIEYYKGVWFIEFVSLAITFLFLYKIARFKCGKLGSLCVLIISVAPLKTYFPGGNLTEEYALPYIAIALYVFIDFFLNQQISRKRIFLSGICLGCVLMLRPNMIAIWAVFCISIFMWCVIKQDYKTTLNYTLFFIVGVSIVLIPILIWLKNNDALYNMVESYIIFNLKYVSDDVRASWSNRWKSFTKFSRNDIVLLSSFCSIALAVLHKDIFHISYVFSILLSLLSICMSGQTYNHYGMILIPILVYPLSCFFAENKNTKDKFLKYLVFATLCSFIVVRVEPEWQFLYKNAIKCYNNRNKIERTDERWKIAETINKYTSPEDYITVFGNNNIFYVLTRKLSASRYSYQFPLTRVNPEILKDYFSDLQKNNPKIIVISNSHFKNNKVEAKEMKCFIDDYGYELLKEKFKNFSLYVKRHSQKEVQSLKDQVIYLQKENEKLKNDSQKLQTIQSGWSWKIGRFITYIPRKILGKN